MSDSVQLLFDIVKCAEDVLSSRELDILYARNGYPTGESQTLEEIAASIGGLTRERIRQIEKKAIEKLNSQLAREEIILKYAMFFEANFNRFRMYSDGDYTDFFEPSYIMFTEYLSIVDKETFLKSTALYLALTDNKARIKISNKFSFVYNSSGVSEADASLDVLGHSKDVLSVSEVSDLDDYHKKILLANYRLNDGIYLKKGLSKRDIILAVIDEYFPNGIRPTDDNQLDYFNKCYKNKFDVDNKFTYRELASAMFNSGDYCYVDNGTYLRFSKCNKIPSDLLKELVDYALADGGTIYYSTIFSMFKDQLEENGINNWYYLKGVFDRQTEGRFFNRKANFSVNSTNQFEDPIYDYLVKADGLVTLQELRNKFPGLKDYMFFFRINANKDIISLEGNRFIHIYNLHISEEDKGAIQSVIKSKIDNSDYGIVSSRSIYPFLKIYYPDLCKRLGVANEQFGLFSVCSCLFSDEYDFSRPFIGKIGTEKMTTIGVASRYVDDLKLSKFSFDDLDSFLSKYNTFVNDKIKFVLGTSGKYLLVNDKEFINLQYINIDNRNQIKDFLVFTTNRFGEMRIGKFSNYYMIPKNPHIYWNKASLLSFINGFCKDELEVVIVNGSFECLDYIIRRKTA